MNDVKVKIDLKKPVGYVGIGIPLILECVAEDAEAKAYTKCTSLDDVKTAGYEATTDMYKTAELIFMQDNPPKEIAICTTNTTVVEWLTTTGNLTKEWRHLICINAKEETAAIIAEIEKTTDKMFFAGVAVDDATKYTTENINRTVMFYCTSTKYAYPEAAFVGATAGLTAGSFTYKNIILKGIEPQELSDSEIENIHKKGGITFVTKAGDNVTSEGKTLGGEYIDIIDSKDYIIQQITYRTQKLLNKSRKIAYDNNGIAMLESVTVDVLQSAYNNGIIANTADGAPDYSVNYILRENTKETDRAKRNYVGGSFTFALAGAIHFVEITGEITL